MTGVDWIVLGLAIGTLLGGGHFIWFPKNLKEVYMGITPMNITYKGIGLELTIYWPNSFIIALYLFLCLHAVVTL
jgi:hypothetical protein